MDGIDQVASRRTYSVRWQRAGVEEILECRSLTAERVVSRLRNALREHPAIVIHKVEPEHA